MDITELQLYGAGGHGKVVAEAWELSGGRIVMVVDDNRTITTFKHHRVLSPDRLENAIQVFVSIGSNTARKNIVNKLNSFLFAKVIHPNTIVSSSANLGGGTLVMPGVVVNPGVKIGTHCILNSSSIIEHDSELGDFVHVAPGAVICGGARIGPETLIGANATILPAVKIGFGSTIGAGSVVLKDVPDRVVVAGNPSRIIKRI